VSTPHGTFMSSPLQASTPTRDGVVLPPPSALDQLQRQLFSSHPAGHPKPAGLVVQKGAEEASSSNSTPSSTRSSSPCSLGSTGSFDFEHFKGRRNSWAHPADPHAVPPKAFLVASGQGGPVVGGRAPPQGLVTVSVNHPFSNVLLFKFET
jgi:hypothetical protein